MKIAVIGAKTLPPKQGGIEHVCSELYPRIVSKGHRVDFFARASATGQPWYNKHDYQGVRVISLPGLNTRGLDAVSTSALGALSANSNYDIIHFHAIGPALFSGISRLVAPKAKIVVTCHGLDWQREKWGRFAKAWLHGGERTAVRLADEIIVVSDALKQYFWQTYQRKSIYIPNAAAGYANSGNNFSYGARLGLKRERYLVFLGRLVPEKCPHLLIEAFKQLQPKGWKLVMIGETSDTSDYSAQLISLAGNDENIKFTGELRGSLLAEIMRGAGLFVLPSRLEGMPLALLEAMQEGLPVIASDIAPHKYLIGHDRGILFRTGNVEDCMRALNWAIHNPNQMTTLATNAMRHTQQHHTWDNITNKTLELYENLMELPTGIPTPSRTY